MPDTTQRVGLEFEVHRGGDVNAAAELKQQIAELSTSLEVTERSSNNVTQAMENDFRRVGVPLTQTGILLRDLKSRIDEIRSSGGVIPPEFVSRVEQLEQAQNNAIAATGKWQASAQQTQRALDDATQAAGGQVKQINSLGDAYQLLEPKLQNLVIRWGAAAGAVGVFHQSLEALESRLGSFAKQMGGIGDEFEGLGSIIPVPTKAFREFGSVLADSQGYVERHTGAIKNEAEAMNLERERMEAVLVPLRRLTAAREEAHKANVEYAKSLGLSKTALAEEGASFAAFVKDFAEGNKQIAHEDIVKMFGPQLDALRKRYSELKTAARGDIADMIADWKNLSGQTTAATTDQVNFIGGLIKAFGNVADAAHAQIPPLVAPWKAIEDAIKQVGVAAQQSPAAAEAAIQAFLRLTAGFADAAKSAIAFADLMKNQQSLDAYAAAVQRLHTTLEGLSRQANKTAVAVKSVFQGYGHTGFNYDPSGANDSSNEPVNVGGSGDPLGGG